MTTLTTALASAQPSNERPSFAVATIGFVSSTVLTATLMVLMSAL
jgi:hypothetical protein